MDNLQQGIQALNVDIASEQSDMSLVGDTAPAAAAAPAATEPAAEAGGNDLGFLDVQVPSAQEVAAEQSQANKMANIMGAFGGAQAAAQPPMGGMGSPTSFGMATNNIGMQNPGMVNQTVNNGMAGINNMQAAGMQSQGMNQGGFGNMQAPMASPMGGAAQMSPMSTMAPPMSSTQAAPSANSNNTANAMPTKSDPFASLGALTGIAPKAT